MPVVVAPGTNYNNRQISKLQLVSSNGYALDLTTCLGGDIKITPVKTGAQVDRVRGKATQSLAAEETDGSITIPLNARSLTDTSGVGQPTVTEIVMQKNGGTVFVPFTTISGTDSDGEAGFMTVAPALKCWQFLIELNPRRAGQPTSSARSRLTVYAELPNPDLEVKDAGGISTYTLTADIRRDFAVALANV